MYSWPKLHFKSTIKVKTQNINFVMSQMLKISEEAEEGRGRGGGGGGGRRR
jgi:hypothetical protein